MDIGSSDSLGAAQALNLWQMARTNPKASDVVDKSSLAGEASFVAQTAATTEQGGTANLLSTNFVKTTYETSQYISSTLERFQNEKSFANQMSSVLSAMTAQVALVTADGNSQYVAATMMRSRIEQGVGNVVRQGIADTSQANLNALKDGIEQQAEGDGTTTDSSADSGQTAPDATAAGTSSAAPAETPATTSASAGGGSQSDTGQSASAATGQAVATEGGDAAANAPQVSVDIMV